jgi:hypothetical protein
MTAMDDTLPNADEVSSQNPGSSIPADSPEEAERLRASQALDAVFSEGEKFCKALQDSLLLAHGFSKIHSDLKAEPKRKVLPADLEKFAASVYQAWPRSGSGTTRASMFVQQNGPRCGEALLQAIQSDSVEEVIKLLCEEVEGLALWQRSGLPSKLPRNIHKNVEKLRTVVDDQTISKTKIALREQIRGALDRSNTSYVGRNQLLESSVAFGKAISGIRGMRDNFRKALPHGASLDPRRPRLSGRRSSRRPLHGSAFKTASRANVKSKKESEEETAARLALAAGEAATGKYRYGLSTEEIERLPHMGDKEKADYAAGLIEKLCDTMRSNWGRIAACGRYDRPSRLLFYTRDGYADAFPRAWSNRFTLTVGEDTAETQATMAKLRLSILNDDGESFDRLLQLNIDPQEKARYNLANRLTSLAKKLKSESCELRWDAKKATLKELTITRRKDWHPVEREKLLKLADGAGEYLKMMSRPKPQ